MSFSYKSLGVLFLYTSIETGAPVKFVSAGEPDKIKAFALSDGLLVKGHEFRAIAIGSEE